MCAPPLTVLLLLASPVSSAQTRVYRYTDSHGVEHYVDHPEAIPPGVKAEPLDLSDVPLNPEIAKALSTAAQRAAKPVAVAKPAAPGASPSDPASPPPADAKLFLWWALGLTFSFLGLSLLTSALRSRAPALAFALGVVRLAAGSLALMSWAGTAYEYRESRRWLTEHFPPLRALNQAIQTKAQVDRQTQQLEQNVDKALRGE